MQSIARTGRSANVTREPCGRVEEEKNYENPRHAVRVHRSMLKAAGEPPRFGKANRRSAFDVNVGRTNPSCPYGLGNALVPGRSPAGSRVSSPTANPSLGDGTYMVRADTYGRVTGKRTPRAANAATGTWPSDRGRLETRSADGCPVLGRSYPLFVWVSSDLLSPLRCRVSRASNPTALGRSVPHTTTRFSYDDVVLAAVRGSRVPAAAECTRSAARGNRGPRER